MNGPPNAVPLRCVIGAIVVVAAASCRTPQTAEPLASVQNTCPELPIRSSSCESSPRSPCRWLCGRLVVPGCASVGFETLRLRGTGLTATTDERGFFDFAPPAEDRKDVGAFTLEVRHGPATYTTQVRRPTSDDPVQLGTLELVHADLSCDCGGLCVLTP